jgi:OFA family oxalate/formate antiporter-like MFS transporter
MTSLPRPKATEERLEEIRRLGADKAFQTGQTNHPQIHGQDSYYNLPALKPPLWTWEVPLYFFVGGISGVSACLAFFAHIFNSDPALVRLLLWIALGGAAICPALLISDLGRPSRFLNMLRVFKWRSPMSMGVWILVAFSGCVFLAVASNELVLRGFSAQILFPLRWAAEAASTITGLLLASYTAVLIGATAIPVWSENRTILPAHFLTSGLGGAAGILELAGFLIPVTQVLGFAAAGIETLLGAWFEIHRPPVNAPLHHGRSAVLFRIAGALAGPGALLIRIVWGSAPAGRYAAAACFLVGALLSRYAWIWAGRASAKEPEVQFAFQRSQAKARERSWHVVTDRLPNRWEIAAAAVVMQVCLGAVYAWSVFVKPLVNAQHWTLTQVSLAFTINVFFIGVGTVIGGLWMDNAGPRKVATVAGIIYGAGYILASVAASQHSLTMLYLSYGVLAGTGGGMAYICPVTTVAKWFPDKRGVMTGLAVAGYGAGALLMGPVAARRIVSSGIPATFLVFGIGYLIFVVLSAQLFANPPADWKPEGWVPTGKVAQAATKESYTVKEATRTWQFFLLWGMLFLNVLAGIMIISQASPLAQQQIHLTAVAAGVMVGLLGIFNAAGRFFWAWLSDLIGRSRVYLLLYVIQAVVFVSLPRISTQTVFFMALAAIYLCYGGGFGTMPSFTADYFGSKYMGGIYGWILLAWGVGGVVSPLMIARLRQVTGQYTTAIYIIAAVMAVSTILPLIARAPAKGAAARDAIKSVA